MGVKIKIFFFDNERNMSDINAAGQVEDARGEKWEHNPKELRECPQPPEAVIVFNRWKWVQIEMFLNSGVNLRVFFSDS